MAQVNTIEELVKVLRHSDEDAILSDYNDPGYVLKKLIEHCYRNDILFGTAVLKRYVSSYYMGEPVNVPFELPVIVFIIGNKRYELQLSEEGNEMCLNLIPDDFEVQQDVAKLNHLLHNEMFRDPDDMWNYIAANMPDLNEYVHERAIFQDECEEVLEELGVQLVY